MATDVKAVDRGRCQAMNTRGERCRKQAVNGRFCLTHNGTQDMSELGRRGGLVKPTTRLRAAADDSLREQARETLSRALANEEVSKTALDAARSLFSYRADPAPADRHAESRSGCRMGADRPALPICSSSR